ncbi:MAG TPA: hypothetical protein QGI71_03670 [Dehalococcoidia bacterium]|jgi:hypothetical protein|nr:hypothetical protein [Dehalococcoidia bacterium]
MSESEILDLALRLWPQARDSGVIDDPEDLDRLLASQNQPGAPNRDCGQRHTFACFAPDAEAKLTLATGESAEGDDARFIAHLLITRTLLAVGLAIDERVSGAMADAYAFSWTAVGADYRQSPLALAASLWLIALDPSAISDHPIAIDWSPDCFDDADRWDPDYRLFSHYDIRERALDWAMYISGAAGRIEGVSVWTLVEPLLRMESDWRTGQTLGQLAEVADAGSEQAPAAAMLERNRVSNLLRAHLAGRTA